MICNFIRGSASAFYLLIGAELAALLELTQAIIYLIFGVENSYRYDFSCLAVTIAI